MLVVSLAAEYLQCPAHRSLLAAGSVESNGDYFGTRSSSSHPIHQSKEGKHSGK